MWVQENAVLNLSCEASGHPQPTISWNVNGSVSRRFIFPFSKSLLRPRGCGQRCSSPLSWPSSSRQLNGTQIRRQ